MKRSTLAIVIFIVVLLVGASYATYYYLSIPRDSARSDSKETLGNTENTLYTDLFGNQITFAEHEGKVRVVTTWASWNPFSITDLQTFNTVASNYTDGSVVFLAINRKESKEQAERFLKSLPELPHLRLVIDQNDSFYHSIGGFAMPESVVFNRQGNITARKQGTISESELRGYIEEAQKED